MKSMLKTGVAGLSMISLLALVPSCTRDTGQADDASTSKNDAASTEVGAGADAGLDGAVDDRPLSLTARLVDEDNMADMKAIVVQVEVTGIRLVDPASGHDMGGAFGTSGAAGTATETGDDAVSHDSKDAARGAEPDATTPAMTTPAGGREGHVHYRLDAGPVIATPATRLSFHELTPGEHTVTVRLAASDHTPLGPEQTLTFVIPS